MSVNDQLKRQAIPKFKSHYVRYYDLEQISRESVEESRALQEGATLRYLQACQQCRSRGSARGAACSSKTGPELPAAAYFAKALEQELTRVRRYADIFSEETWVRLGSVVDSLSKVATPRAVGEFLAEENLQNLTGVCHEIGTDIVQLDEFLRQNVVACAHLAQKHDMMAFGSKGGGDSGQDSSLNLVYIQAMEQNLMSSVDHGTILVNLSDIYSQIRQLQSATHSSGWFTPKSGMAENQSMKFWVHPGNVLKLKCEVVKHLPIRTNERDAYMSSTDRGKKLSFLKDELVQEWHLVRSLYFDDDFCSNYSVWMESEGEGSVVRASWYGDRGIGSDKSIYLEKRFKENRANAREIEELAGVDANEFDNFLAGKKVPAIQGEGLHSKWLENLQKRLNSRNEAPRLRTENHRTVFEEKFSSEVLMSLDTHIRFMRDPNAMTRISSLFTNLQSKYSENKAHHFPYAILEIEVAAENTPLWLKDLMSSGMLVSVPNFSKYLHGTAVLFPDRINQHPEWFVENLEGKKVPGNLDQMVEIFKQNNSPNSKSMNLSLGKSTVPDSHGIDRNASVGVREKNTIRLKNILASPEGNVPEPEQRDMLTTRSLAAKAPTKDYDSAKESSQSGGVSEEHEFKSARMSWPRKKAKNNDISGSGVNKQDTNLPKAPALVRTRIEPKTFFANERTFLSWLSIAILVMFMGLSLLGGESLGRGKTTGNTTSSDPTSFGAAHISGALITPISIILLAYSLYVYRSRTRQILLRETVRYDDQRGPILITVILILVLIMSYIMSLKAAFGHEKEASHVVLQQP